MDEESLSRICVSAFSDSEIVTAKRLLFESLSAVKSMKTRRRDGKTLRDIDDIICLVKVTDPEKLPVFVARELQKLTPVLFDHVDVTRILKDLVKMRSEIELITEQYATKKQFDALKSDVESLKKASLVNNFASNVNTKRGSCFINSFGCDSGPTGLSPVREYQREENISTQCLSSFSVQNKSLEKSESDQQTDVGSTQNKLALSAESRELTIIGHNNESAVDRANVCFLNNTPVLSHILSPVLSASPIQSVIGNNKLFRMSTQ
ncbi:unnamed protein product [Diatraea saccharalis]|uniref:Uncharacterized protein n=1 Tax=Diatraea saccharalis TaxID=40085 RepID=A0A9N9QTZ0_9NEOP|nr:unnamed protein product [Diatraea saccharalis]